MTLVPGPGYGGTSMQGIIQERTQNSFDQTPPQNGGYNGWRTLCGTKSYNCYSNRTTGTKVYVRSYLSWTRKSLTSLKNRKILRRKFSNPKNYSARLQNKSAERKHSSRHHKHNSWSSLRNQTCIPPVRGIEWSHPI